MLARAAAGSLLTFVALMPPAFGQGADPNAANAGPGSAADTLYWQSVKDSGSAAELQSYIDAFPNGIFVNLARIRIGATGGAAPAAKAGSQELVIRSPAQSAAPSVAPTPAPVAPAAAAVSTQAVSGELLPSLSDLAEKLAPTVVKIVATPIALLQPSQSPPAAAGTPGSAPTQIPDPSNPMPDFSKLFPDTFAKSQAGDGAGGASTPPARTLSGFFVAASGYIVTADVSELRTGTLSVETSSGETLSAAVVGTDARNGLAVLKVEAVHPFPATAFADDPPRLAEWVLMIGSSFGYAGSASFGIVASPKRTPAEKELFDYLQIDATVDDGNLGGPVFDLDGKVIGVNLIIDNPNHGLFGLAFAAPAAAVQPVVAALEANGHVDRGYLGVSIQDVTPDEMVSLGLTEAGGALVAGVTENSPAAGAGLAVGDVILEVNGEKVAGGSDLSRRVASFGANTAVTLLVAHAGATHAVEVTLGPAPN